MGGFRLLGPECNVLRWYNDRVDDGTLNVGRTACPGILRERRYHLLVPDLRLSVDPLLFSPRPNLFDIRFELPAPTAELHDDAEAATGSRDDDDDDAPHLGFDLATGVTANYPRGRSPSTYAVSLVLRDWNLRTFGGHDSFLTLDLLHEPNIGFQLSPDPDNQLVFNAAISLVNVHLRLFDHEIETALAAQVQRSMSGATSFAAQAQVEIHINTMFSLTLATSVQAAPPSDTPDRGSVGMDHAGIWSWQPFNVGALVHLP